MRGADLRDVSRDGSALVRRLALQHHRDLMAGVAQARNVDLARPQREARPRHLVRELAADC